MDRVTDRFSLSLCLSVCLSLSLSYYSYSCFEVLSVTVFVIRDNRPVEKPTCGRKADLCLNLYP